MKSQIVGHDHYIKTLDGWRALAVILVTLSHLRDAVLTKSSLFYPFFSWGLNGVDLFFALSGYLITIKLIFELETKKTIDFKKFYLKRFFRLLPASWFYLLVISVFSFFQYIHVEPVEVISTVTFWRNYLHLPNHLVDYTGQFWSLSVEEHFYFFLPAFLFYSKDPKKIIKRLVLLGLGVTIWRKMGTTSSLTQIAPFIEYDIWSTLGRFDALLYGVLLAYLQTYRSEILNKLMRYLSPYVMIAAIFLISYFSIPLKATFEALFFPLLIYSTIFHDQSFISKILELRPFRYLGMISYSFYIWQQFFIAKMENGPALLRWASGEWHSFAFIFIAASLSYHCIENPMRKFGYKLIKNRKL